jgi:UDP-glucose 4-epimerase
MRVLITGGAGFIGSNLADRLLDQGHDVFIVDDLSTGKATNVNPNATFLEASIADRTVCEGFFKIATPDVVVHAAASYKDQTDWQKDIAVNVLGTANVVKCAMAHDVKRFIYFQTSLCYGHHPIEQPITLEHPIRPDNSYSISKTAGEQFIEMSGLDFVSFRLANVYGPRNLSGPIPTFFHRLVNDQECFISDARRDFIYIDDLLDIVEMAMDGHGEKGFYHVGSGHDDSIETIFNYVAGAMDLDFGTTEEPSKMFGRFWDDVKTILIDPSKTLEVFGMIPSTPLSEGIPKAIEWYYNNEVVETYTHLSADELKVRAAEHAQATGG